jgi:hypothetical protein
MRRQSLIHKQATAPTRQSSMSIWSMSLDSKAKFVTRQNPRKSLIDRG